LEQNLSDGSKKAMVVHSMAPEETKDKTFVLLKEKIITDTYGIAFYTNSDFRESYMDKLLQLTNSGIVEKIRRDIEDPPKPPIHAENIRISIDHLLIWFQLWAGLLMVAVLFFLLEILVAKIATVLMKKALRALKQIGDSFEEA
jgi:hypothetical protein